MISKPMIHLAHSKHLSYPDPNTISKQKEARFHRTHVTYEFHRVCPKWFPSLWYVPCKPCTYFASKISTIQTDRAFTWASSPRSTIGCIQNDLWADGTFDTNLHLSCTDTNTVSKRKEVRFHMTHITYEFHQVCLKRFLSLWYVNAYRAPILRQD
jgi:hypothetical protein